MAPNYGGRRDCGSVARQARNGLFLVFLVSFVISPWSVSSSHASSPLPNEPVTSNGSGFPEAMLLFAAAIGSVDQTRKLLADGADLEITGPNGETPLLRALRNSFFAESLATNDPLALLLDNPYSGIEYLVQRRFAAIRATAPEHFPLARPVPAHSGYAATALYLLDQGASAETRDHTGSSVLQYACVFGFNEVVQRLIAAGVALDGGDEAISPIMLAALFGHEEIVRQLIAAGAEVSVGFGNGFSPVVLAAMAGYRNIVALLSRPVASLSLPGEDLRALLQFWQNRVIAEDSVPFVLLSDLLGQGSIGGDAGSEGATLLMAACRGRSPAVVRLLLEHGGRDVVNQADSRGWTALMYAAAGSDERASAMIVDILLQIGAKVDATGSGGRTALLVALEAGNEQTAMQLVAAGADPAVHADDGLTPLMIASFHGMSEVVEVLLDRRVDVGAILPNGVAAIHLAAYSGAVNVLRLLVDVGAAVDIPTGSGYTPLVVAIRSCPLDLVAGVVHFLLSQGAEVDLAGDDGRTAFWFARQRAGLASVLVLLEQHAEIRQSPGIRFSYVDN